MSARRKALVYAAVAVALFVAVALAAREEHTGGLDVRTLWAIYGIVLALLALVLFGRVSSAVRRVALFTLLVVVLYLLLPRLVSGSRTLELLRDADWRILGVAVVIEFVALLGYANLFRHILRVVDIRVHLARMYSIVLAGLAASHLLGAGGAAGWVVTYNALRKQEAPHGLIFVAIAAQNFFNYIVLWLLFLAAIAWGLLSGELDPLRYSVALLLIGFFLWLSAYGIYLYNHRTKMRRRVNQVAGFVNRFRKAQPITSEHIDEWLDHFFAGMRRMSTHRGAKRLALTYSLVFWAFDMLCLYLTFRAFGHHVGFTPLAISYVVAYAVGTLTPTPGGLGAVETLMITMLIGFGVPSAEATIVVLSYRLINFWLPVPPGLVSYAFIR